MISMCIMIYRINNKYCLTHLEVLPRKQTNKQKETKDHKVIWEKPYREVRHETPLLIRLVKGRVTADKLEVKGQIRVIRRGDY